MNSLEKKNLLNKIERNENIRKLQKKHFLIVDIGVYFGKEKKT
jgi:hypothetical protein